MRKVLKNEPKNNKDNDNYDANTTPCRGRDAFRQEMDKFCLQIYRADTCELAL